MLLSRLLHTAAGTLARSPHCWVQQNTSKQLISGISCNGHCLLDHMLQAGMSSAEAQKYCFSYRKHVSVIDRVSWLWGVFLFGWLGVVLGFFLFLFAYLFIFLVIYFLIILLCFISFSKANFTRKRKPFLSTSDNGIPHPLLLLQCIVQHHTMATLCRSCSLIVLLLLNT